MFGANLGLLFAMFAWATQIPATGVLLQNWDPYFLGAVRYAGGVPVLWLLLRLTERGSVPAAVARWRIWLLGAVGVGLFAPIYTLGLAHANPVTAAILVSSAPAVAAIVARLCFGVPIERGMIPAIGLAVLGCGLATYDPSRPDNPFDLKGGEPLFILGSALWSWYSLAAQRWMPGWSQLRISVATLAPGSLVAVGIYLLAALVGLADPVPNALRSPLDLELHLWVSVGGVSFALLFWNYGVRQLGVVVASLFLNLMPVFTILVLALMGTRPTALQLAGTGLVILGLLQAQLRALMARRPEPAVAAAIPAGNPTPAGIRPDESRRR